MIFGIIALICFALAAFKVQLGADLIAIGLAFLTASLLFHI